jgi:hypothetical protein
MHEAELMPTLTSGPKRELIEAAQRAERWFGEPFLQADDDPEVALAPGTARRAALDDALAELEAGNAEPSYRWKVRYGLMLGLERVLTESPVRTKAGTELRRHQVDALAGMLTELIASVERGADENWNGGENGSGNGVVAEAELEEEDDFDAGFVEDGELEGEFHGADPGAVRRYRFRHPTASGKTIAAAGFVDAARTLGVTSRPRATATASRTPSSPARGRESRIRSRSRHTRGSRGTGASSTARRTTSSSATRPIPRSVRRRAPRSAPSTSRCTSG